MIGLTHASHRLILQIIIMQYCCLNFQSLDSVPNLIEQSMESNQNHHSIMVCSRSKQKTIPNLLKTKLPLPPLPSLLAHPSLQHNLHITVPNPQSKCCDTSSKDLFTCLPLNWDLKQKHSTYFNFQMHAISVQFSICSVHQQNISMKDIQKILGWHRSSSSTEFMQKATSKYLIGNFRMIPTSHSLSNSTLHSHHTHSCKPNIYIGREQLPYTFSKWQQGEAKGSHTFISRDKEGSTLMGGYICIQSQKHV